MNNYKFEIEIFEGKGGELQKVNNKIVYPKNVEQSGICAWMYHGDDEKSYKQGKKFNYPEDLGQLCPWMVESVNRICTILESGGTLGWRYKGTPYQKDIDSEGITTEFIRCIDPTACGIVLKVIRTKI